MFIKYLFPLAKIKYLVSENMFKKYRANMQSVVLFQRSGHNKDNGAVQIQA